MIKKIFNFGLSFCILIFGFWTFSFAQEQLSSNDFVIKSWEASGNNNLEKVLEYTNKCIELYKLEADKLEAQLSNFPLRGHENEYQVLNDVATCMFIQAEALMRNGKIEEAKKVFKEIIKNYKFAQAWDPRGWFWSVAEKSQDSLNKVEQKPATVVELPKLKPKIKTTLKLTFPGTEDVVNYKKYGRFKGIGTKSYKLEITDPVGLAKATGEGIYPNTNSLFKSEGYKKAKKEGRLEGSHWDFLYSDDLEASFYKWVTASEPGGVKLFYIGFIFERAKLYKEAVKAYYAIVVNFPGAIGWTYWHTPWYPGQAAIAKIRFLLRRHPELGLRLEGAKIRIINGFDNDVSNDIVITNPGALKKTGKIMQLICNLKTTKIVSLKKSKIKKTIGKGKVKLVQYQNNHWQMMVDGKPYVIKGITYAPTKVCQSPDNATLKNWMEEDTDRNNKIDGPYDSWVDKNLNNTQDKDEPTIGDFKLLKEMGVNTIRLYYRPEANFKINKELLRELYNNYGIRVIMGDFLGKYAIGSGASWYEGTDYSNPKHQENMLNSIKNMVNEFKHEPYILFWLLGNENNYGVACNADKKPKDFYAFANSVAKWIKSVDSDHPVAITNGDTLFLDIFAKNAPDIDIFGANAYRGDYGFGSFWEQVYEATGKPAFITEYGSPAYAEGKSFEEAEALQADYLLGCWEDIEYNLAGSKEGVGNALGAVVFEWLDEWWKAYEPCVHDTKGLFAGPFPDGFMHEEWLGVASQGDGLRSPFLRQLRKGYYEYQRIWREK
ncbi:MAG: glycoside hydrolase family 2 TIM barrel-domain containing protein [Candidatus Omnitrophota bacterium]|nr:glycoside hydrolase family 2 TIM barrel-domain containing protein [Candidatus Omnitrophota bacterium]